MHRRHFLKFLAAGLLIDPKILFSNEFPTPLSILQGATTNTRTQLAVLVPKDSDWTYTLREKGQPFQRSPQRVRRWEYPSSEWAVDHVHFDQLRPYQPYIFQVSDRLGEWIDERELESLDLNKENPRLAFMSCMRDSKTKEQRIMWARVIESQPDVLFFLGDNVYVSALFANKPDKVWKRYAETRNSLDIFKTKRLIPTFALWDDHDYGDGDNGGASYPHKEQTKQIFKAFFPQEPMPGLENGPGISNYWRAFGQNFFLMDGRSFRTGKTLWGDEQENWLRSQIDAHDKSPIWILNGTAITGKHHGEGYQKKYPKLFQSFIEFGRGLSAPLVFASGDVHYSELNQVREEYFNYQTYELVSSAIHSSTHIKLPNPERIVSAEGDNFLLAELSRVPNIDLDLIINIQSIGRKDIYFRHQLEISRGASS